MPYLSSLFLRGEGVDDVAGVGVVGVEGLGGEFGAVGGVGVTLTFDGYAVVVVIFMAIGTQRRTSEPVARIELHAGLVAEDGEHAA